MEAGEDEHRFRDWFACPDCGADDGVSSLAHGTEIVFECHSCGLVSEYVIGQDVSLQNLDLAAIKDLADGLGETSP